MIGYRCREWRRERALSFVLPGCRSAIDPSRVSYWLHQPIEVMGRSVLEGGLFVGSLLFLLRISVCVLVVLLMCCVHK